MIALTGAGVSSGANQPINQLYQSNVVTSSVAAQGMSQEELGYQAKREQGVKSNIAGHIGALSNAITETIGGIEAAGNGITPLSDELGEHQHIDMTPDHQKHKPDQRVGLDLS